MPTFKHKPTGKRFFFAHIPRTAGRFIEYNFVLVEKNECMWDPDEQLKFDNGLGIMSVVHGAEVAHYHKEYYEKYLDVEGIPHFSIIRNPIDRFISGSMYIKRKYGDDIQELMEDEMYFYSMLDNMPVQESVNWYRPMVDFMTEKTNIWRFEDGFGDDFVSWLSGIIGIDLEFEHDVYYPKAKDESNKLEKTPKLIHNLKHLYRKDIEAFYPELATPFEEGTEAILETTSTTSSKGEGKSI